MKATLTFNVLNIYERLKVEDIILGLKQKVVILNDYSTNTPRIVVSTSLQRGIHVMCL